ncbi:MAG: BadF/BadG/BcrA/BcrD ATPase family protein [Syntrophales bacterium]
MEDKTTFLVDAGIENIRIRCLDADGRVLSERSCPHQGKLKAILAAELGPAPGRNRADGPRPGIFLTGKLAAEAAAALGGGTQLMSEAVLRRAAGCLLDGAVPPGVTADSVAIIDFSASGYCVVTAGRGQWRRLAGVTVNPTCGAGSGVNLRRILEKLAIAPKDADRLLAAYLGEAGAGLRGELPVRTERCGVFSVSATVSDKNQGIPVAHALAVTMKSEAAKPCGRVPAGVESVILTGGVFRWQFMRDCAADILASRGVRHIRYDEGLSPVMLGMGALAADLTAEAPRSRLPALRARGDRGEPLPSFGEIRERLASGDRFIRQAGEAANPSGIAALANGPVDIALDIGSSMAKMAVASALGGDILYRDCIPNKGDALQTVRALLGALGSAGVQGLAVQHWGLTGSGRYQIRKILQAVYPHLRDRIVTMVENEAHVLGSLGLLEGHIAFLAARGRAPVNRDFGLLVDIGGEDTKISVISLRRRALLENAMNCKCSAGTGSLMDILRDLLAVPDVERAYGMAGEARQAWKSNATCAVFLMEEARRMQARGVPPAEILASCCHAIVENMARTLWKQVTIPPNPVVLLHGQTMKSDPLALATVDCLERHFRGPVYGLIPPDPGHRACYGLLSRAGEADPIVTEFCDWERFTGWSYERKLISCPGRVCGNERMRCTRTAITSREVDPPLALAIGGCTSVNESAAGRAPAAAVPDAYREIWQWIDGRHPRSESPDRLVIPRCFTLSQYAYGFAELLEALGLAVHCDTVREEDIRTAQECFSLDTCAPLIGATGQCIRLAGEPHGLIFLPQIDFLPTGGVSLGRTCTTNQGGIWAAVQFARAAHPGARFLVAAANLGDADEAALTRRLYRSFGELFARTGLSVDLARFREAWRFARDQTARLNAEKAEMTAAYLEAAARSGAPVTVVCGREYVLTPGVYDQHISKTLKDKGIVPVPSYAFDTVLDPRFGHVYWRNAHDVLTKVEAVVQRRLHTLIGPARLKAAVRSLEEGEGRSRISHAVLTTFRCGPDSITAPLMQEISRPAPFLWIQSDGTIAELAHLENRIMTHLRRLEQRGDLRGATAGPPLRLEVLGEFTLDGLDPARDVVHVPTLGDNRVITAVIRAMGFTVVDNYTDEGYDLEAKGRTGRQHVGDAVCVPLAAVFADMLGAVEDFLARRRAGDPLVRGKDRIVLFMNGGDGPCRLGQYIHVFKLAFTAVFGRPEIPCPAPGGSDGSVRVRFLENISSSLADRGDVLTAVAPWAGILGYQGVVCHGLFHSLLARAAARCRDEASFGALQREYRQLKEAVHRQIEFGAPPGPAAGRLVEAVSRRAPLLAGVAKYLGYGLWNNFGLRRLFRDFAERWIVPARGDGRPVRQPIRIHLDGEVYMRTTQSEAILRLLNDHLGYGAFELTVAPTWCYFEALLVIRLLDARARLADRAAERDGAPAAEAAADRQVVRDTLGTIGNLRNLLARPLYAAAGVPMPHPMAEVYAAAEPIIPTGKPYGELVPFVGEAVLRCREGVDLILNVAPQGCMVSGMGEMLVPSILDAGGALGRTTIAPLASRDGEVDEEQLRLALLRALGDRWHGVLPSAVR